MSPIYKSEAGRHRVEQAYRTLLARWPVPAEFVTVPTRQGDTFVVVSGPEDAPPVIFLHGSIGNATTWLGEIADYAAHFRCYCVDIIGEPGFSAPSRPDERSDAYVLWLDDVLDGLGLDRVSFVTVSLGGLFAFQYGAARSDRITALAGNAPAGICRNKNFALNFLPYFFLGAWGKRRIREAIMGKLPEANSSEVREFTAFFDLLTTEFRPRMITLPVLSDDEIRRLAFPVLAIVGGKDVLLSSEQTRDRLTALAPEARVVYLPEGRHYIPDALDTVLPFLVEANGLPATAH